MVLFGDEPCVVLMVDAHLSPEVRYPVSELAARYGASIDEETSDPEKVYAGSGAVTPARCNVRAIGSVLWSVSRVAVPA